MSIDGRMIVGFKELVIDRWSLPSSQANAYRSAVETIGDSAGLLLRATQRFGKVRPPDAGGVIGGKFTFSIYMAMVVLWVLGSLVKSFRGSH